MFNDISVHCWGKCWGNMARQLAKLSARRAATMTEPGRHSDGGGLYLVVDESGARRWTFIYRWKPPGRVGAGRLREMGLGSFHSVSLEKARKKAAAARELLSDGKDPISHKRIANAVPTFGAVLDDVRRTAAATTGGCDLDR